MSRVTPNIMRKLERLRVMLEAGRAPLVDHDLIASTSTVVAAAATSTVIPVRPYTDGVIVEIDGQAWDPAGGAEVDTMAQRMHEKYLSVLLEIGSHPKTNNLYEPLALLTPRRVLWVVAAQELINVTFKHEATGGIASLHGRLVFKFIPFDSPALGA